MNKIFFTVKKFDEEMDVITVHNGNTSKHIEDRFTAAVNVIRGLPKNGEYFNGPLLLTKRAINCTLFLKYRH